MWSYRGFRRKQKENDESMRYGVEEVFADPKLENLQPKIQDALNRLDSTIADIEPKNSFYFHLIDTGLEGFPFAVVEAHNYVFELSAIYALMALYFVCAGPGRLSAFRKKNKVTYYPKSQG